MSPEEQGEAEHVSLERERLAFNRIHAARIAIQNQFIPLGNEQATQASIDEYYSAESDWKEARAAVKHCSIEALIGP